MQVCWSVVRAPTDDEAVYCIVHVLDVTDRKRYEGQLQYLADHDPLTGLFNRRRFEEELERVVALRLALQEPAALLVVDLDNFKYVNDTLGHALGDEVLGRVAACCARSCARPTSSRGSAATSSRSSCPHTDARGRGRCVAGICSPSARTTRSRRRATSAVYVTASSASRRSAGRRADAREELLVEADVAMYDAKEAGRDRACRVDATRTAPARMRARLTWSQRIRDGARDDGFELWEQPILTIATDASASLELLLRMRGDDGELDPARAPSSTSPSSSARSRRSTAG